MAALNEIPNIIYKRCFLRRWSQSHRVSYMTEIRNCKQKILQRNLKTWGCNKKIQHESNKKAGRKRERIMKKQYIELMGISGITARTWFGSTWTQDWINTVKITASRHIITKSWTTEKMRLYKKPNEENIRELSSMWTTETRS